VAAVKRDASVFRNFLPSSLRVPYLFSERDSFMEPCHRTFPLSCQLPPPPFSVAFSFLSSWKTSAPPPKIQGAKRGVAFFPFFPAVFLLSAFFFFFFPTWCCFFFAPKSRSEFFFLQHQISAFFFPSSMGRLFIISELSPFPDRSFLSRVQNEAAS